MSDPLILEQQACKEQLALLIKKRSDIQKAYDLETDAIVLFKYKEHLTDLNAEIAGVKVKLHDAGGVLHTPNVWTPLLDAHGVRDDLHLSGTVNCNREKHYVEGLLADFKKQMATRHNLFYCIIACPYQRPVSIAKRLVYELEEGKLPVARVADATRPGEVATLTLEFGFDPEHSWQLLWEALRQRLGSPEQPAADLADLAGQRADCRFIAVVCCFGAQHWNAESIEHLRYLTGQFQGMGEANRKYLFLLAVEFPHIHDHNCDRYAKELTQLEQLCAEANRDGLHAACFSLLPPVDPDSIENWSSYVLQREKKQAFNKIVEQLKKQQTTLSDHFDMELVETLQEAAWAYRNRPRPDLPF